ncbi:MAG: cobalt-precorrin-5B (C(1))-methyltransferase [Cucumibacter sp.]
MDETADMRPQGVVLKRGWTTGACATAATKAALEALLGADFPDPVTIRLPGGQKPSFALAHERRGKKFAEAGIVKDAGDDPDVTHGALVIARVCFGAAGSGLRFLAGDGVGTVTKPGLPVAVGEPAINPVPRKMIDEAVAEICARNGVAPDIEVTISIPGGEKLAEKTWNPRLGIVGGLSILGTSGIVVPYSCSAWIQSIRSGIDVARAAGLAHIVGSTGETSERAARERLDLPIEAYIDMGDFVGGMLKYLKRHPVAKVTIAGGFAKLSKLAQGRMDLHSGRGEVDFSMLAEMARDAGADGKLVAEIAAANSAKQVLDLAEAAGIGLAKAVAGAARDEAQRVLGDAPVEAHIVIVDRDGRIVAEI